MKLRAVAVIFAICMFVTDLSFACTDFQIKANDGTVVVGRTMEFAIDLKSDVIAVPRNQKYVSDAPGGKKGLKWATKYGFVAANAFGQDSAVDGLNEAGLSVGFLWLPETKYQEVPKRDTKKAISILYLGNWILGNFATVDEVKENIGKVVVWGEAVPELGIAPPLHVAVHDAGGKSLVIEFIGGEQKIHDNPIGVLTNSPTFDWHITNLRNYTGLTSFRSEPVEMGGMSFKDTGNGSGVFGIPGDWTPPSRFVRVATFKRLADPTKDSGEAVVLTQHILNTVDIPLGDIKAKKKGVGLEEESTQWTVIKDLKNKVFYFRTYEDLSLRAVNLKKLNLRRGGKITSTPMESGSRGIVDITGKLLR
ncbi:MAG: choloylglycine hydrolase family protein [Candidatus Omnitrophota bacterium]